MTNKILKEDEWGASLNTTKNKRPILLTIDYNRFKIKDYILNPQFPHNINVCPLRNPVSNTV